MQTNLEKMYGRIRTLCIFGIFGTVISICVYFVMCNLNVNYSRGIFQSLIMFYIFVQIEEGVGKMVETPDNYYIPVRYCKRVAYACIIIGVGDSIISTIITTASKGEFHLVCSMMQILVGALLFVGASVYLYGCENNRK